MMRAWGHDPGQDSAHPSSLADLRSSKHNADTLVVAKLDRLSRSLLDFAGLMARATKEKWGLIALDLGVDTSTPAGEAMANVLATFAQFERRLIGQRTREALAAKKAQGIHVGRRRAVPEPVVRRILNEREAGRSLQSIADGLNADGVKGSTGGRWYATTVRVVLRSVELEAQLRRARS
jgi:DNA invertase Pin-like site-specific DNA recombinase